MSKKIKKVIIDKIEIVCFFLRKVKKFYLIGTWKLLIGKKQTNVWGRCREVCASSDNKHIPRVKNAGKIIEQNLIMHNGLKVKMGNFAYYGDFAKKVLTTNRGVHEPQEERVFMEVLKIMPENATMIELGAYWGFYSMWFKSFVANSQVYLIEPNENHLASGKENFLLNNLKGTFIKGEIGSDGIKMDNFIKERHVDVVHILHADIEGAELDMLKGCEEAVLNNVMWYFFISTNSQKLHYDCLSFLQDRGYEIIASADHDFGTYSCDGVLIARLKNIEGLDPVKISLRRITK